MLLGIRQGEAIATLGISEIWEIETKLTLYIYIYIYIHTTEGNCTFMTVNFLGVGEGRRGNAYKTFRTFYLKSTK